MARVAPLVLPAKVSGPGPMALPVQPVLQPLGHRRDRHRLPPRRHRQEPRSSRMRRRPHQLVLPEAASWVAASPAGLRPAAVGPGQLRSASLARTAAVPAAADYSVGRPGFALQLAGRWDCPTAVCPCHRGCRPAHSVSCCFRRLAYPWSERFRRPGWCQQVSPGQAVRRLGLGRRREPGWHLAWRRRSQQVVAPVPPGRRVLLPAAVVVRRVRLLWPASAVRPGPVPVLPGCRVSVLASTVARLARVLRWVRALRGALVVGRELALVRSGLPVGVAVVLCLARLHSGEQSRRAVQWVSRSLVVGLLSIEA